MEEQDFRLIVQGLLSRYDGTPLFDRWQEAISFGAGREAIDYWIRDTDGITNVVWINSDGIRDITLVGPLPFEPPSSNVGENEEDDQESSAERDEDNAHGIPWESMFNFIPLRSISSIEVREAPDIARKMGLQVTGHKLVHIIPNSASAGHLYWIATSPREAQDLDRFVKAVLSAYVMRP